MVSRVLYGCIMIGVGLVVGGGGVPAGPQPLAEDGLLKRVADLEAKVVALDQLRAQMPPVGSVVAWVGRLPDSAASPMWHEQWKVCKGQVLESTVGGEVDRSLNDLGMALAGAYGNDSQYSAGDRIVLPDFSGRFLRGVGVGALPIGEAQAEQVGTHSHRINYRHATTGEGGNRDARLLFKWEPGAVSKPEKFFTGPPNAKGDDAEWENRPRNFAVHWIIRIR